MVVYQVSLMSIFMILSSLAKAENTKLLLVQNIIRHGDRAPFTLYPTDPNGIENWPNGLSNLTQRGKSQQYKLGTFLREFYQDFISSDPNEVIANSAALSRCINSAESNLASLYAPPKEFRIAKDFLWQPIPVNYLPQKDDIYLGLEPPCPRFKTAFYRSLNSQKIRDYYRNNQAAVEDISKFSGINFSNQLDAYNLYQTLKGEFIHNLTIPEWAFKYRNEIKTMGQDLMNAYNGSPFQVKIIAGPFLEQVTENMIKKINGSTPYLKFIVNLSHDFNMSGILLALNFTSIPHPPYCATLLFELHEMPDTSKAVRLLYTNSTNPSDHIDKPHVLVLDGCSEFCPLEQFIESYDWLKPLNYTKECQLDPESE